ncbi:MAG: hypothetical protein K2X44_06450 [Magnetospirillum sp.]|nr:hypothetical protein [Magnetospirillum sp.]
MNSLGGAALNVVSTAALIALPVIIYRLVSDLLHKLADEEIHQVPVITTLSRIIGFVSGGLALAGGLDERAFRLTEVFVPDSVWNIPIAGLVLDRGNIFAYDTIGIVLWLASGKSLTASILGGGATLLGLLSCGMCIFFFKRRVQRVAALVLCAATMLLTAWQTVYLTALALWLINAANFWSLALIGLYFQYRRSRH